MRLDPRNLTIEGVAACLNENHDRAHREFEEWYESEDAAVWRTRLEQVLARDARYQHLKRFLRDFSAAAWIQSRISELRAQNEEAKRFLPVDKRELLNG